ncbi:serine/threonine-protein kinase [Variovorax guangxiensis]|uniref:mitogen-activated protein kinase kinase n=2 Tax=Variovorax guangxiensis TaxID=1775474 RepID=A0A840FWV7_9BURK|nr:serine/threonine-protein kinase [Variovorax guangxiensis]
MLDRDVAIKWLVSHEGEEQLFNEWRILANATSRYVVEIYDLVFDHHGVLFGIVMEFVSGETLDKFPVPANKEQSLAATRLLYQFATGIADLHGSEVVHRDIKPDNAMIEEGGRLKICDFGLSGPPNTVTLQARGTLGYRAPELFFSPATVTFKSDVYAFGAVCWKVFTGGFPLIGRSGLPEASEFPIASISTKVPDMPPRLTKIIDSCLARNPSERPDMIAVAMALRNELTRGKHVGSLALGTGPAVMDANTPQKRLGTGSNSIQVSYDEYDFRVDTVAGEVYINNSRAHSGDLLTEGCLLTFGASNLGPQRAFAPFRQFTPEVVI